MLYNKRIISLVLSLLMCVSLLVACSDTDDKPDTTTPNNATTADIAEVTTTASTTTTEGVTTTEKVTTTAEVTTTEEVTTTVTEPEKPVTVLFSEDHADKTLANLIANNSSVTYSSVAFGDIEPLDNLYSTKVCGTIGTTEFSNQFEVVSKSLNMQGSYLLDPANISKNVFSMSNNGNPAAGKGFVTIVPSSVTAGLDSFTLYWVERQYQPTGEALGVVLFYNNAVNFNGFNYFNGYDNYSFTGFTGNLLGTYKTYSIYNGVKTEFPSEAMTVAPAKNSSVVVKVVATKGNFTYENAVYTAKVESYVNDYLISTSYAQWADAPIMLYYESNADYRFDVQFTNIKLTTELK